MKCFVVFFAVIVAAQASVISVPLTYSHVALDHAEGQWKGEGILDSQWKGEGLLESQDLSDKTVLVHSAPAAVLAHHASAHHVLETPVVHAHVAHDHAHIVHAHAPVVHHHASIVVAAPHEASYKAINRGSVHEAPLSGHALSQTSLNLAAAPGTI